MPEGARITLGNRYTHAISMDNGLIAIGAREIVSISMGGLAKKH